MNIRKQINFQRKPKKLTHENTQDYVKVSIIEGRNGLSVVINDYHIAGSVQTGKKILKEWTVPRINLLNIINIVK